MYVYLVYSLYPPCPGKVARAAFEAGRSAVCIIDGEEKLAEKLAEVYKDFSELENSTEM